MDEMIKRINALARKSREEGLTEEEIAEQAELRARYVKAFRQGLMNTLDSVYVMDESGNKRRLGIKH